jgi:16S rRNA (guanine966-N2)-methyltransferase
LARAPQNRVRIIGGQWRSRLLRFPDAPGLRPTPDRVRETLFNWLGQDLSATQCLDLYAGSGALGFEAASRGARRVVLVERERRTVQALQASAQALQAASVEVVHADALEFLQRRPPADGLGGYDVVFLDPPYAFWQQHQEAGSGLLSTLAGYLAPGARVFLESPAFAPLPDGWRALKRDRAGAVHYQLLEART